MVCAAVQAHLAVRHELLCAAAHASNNCEKNSDTVEGGVEGQGEGERGIVISKEVLSAPSLIKSPFPQGLSLSG